MNESKKKKELEKEYADESIIHHIHHGMDKGFSREISINGSVHSVTVQSCDPEENIEYLGKKALELLHKARDGGR